MAVDLAIRVEEVKIERRKENRRCRNVRLKCYCLYHSKTP
jgi:hypothetical protein